MFDFVVSSIRIEDRKEEQSVIVFESGIGMDMGNWDQVINEVSEKAPVLLYGSSGIVNSGPERDTMIIKDVSDRILRMMDYLEIEPLFILVRHSLGGVYVRSFAVYHPEMLAGLIIIDPADFTQTKENDRLPYLDIGFTQKMIDFSFLKNAIQDRIRKSNNSNYLIRRKTDVLRMMRDLEFERIRNSKLPSIPVHILVGGRYEVPPRFGTTEYNDSIYFGAQWKHRVERWTEEILTVDKGMRLYTGDAGHFVHYDDPELLISSVRIILQDYEQLKNKTKKKQPATNK